MESDADPQHPPAPVSPLEGASQAAVGSAPEAAPPAPAAAAGDAAPPAARTADEPPPPPLPVLWSDEDDSGAWTGGSSASGPATGEASRPLAITLVGLSPAFPTPSFAVGGPGLVPPPPAAPRPKASVTFLVVVTVISLAADLVSKGWAKARLSGFDAKAHGVRKVEVLKGHLDFIFAQNPGGAWSFLRGLPDSLRRPFFLVVSAAAIVFIISIYQRVYRDQTAMKWGLPLALGGAMGNLVDRIRYGWVVDFIDVSLRWGGRDHHWPTFNVADIAIVIGVGLMAIDMLRSRGLHAHDDQEPVPAPIR